MKLSYLMQRWVDLPTAADWLPVLETIIGAVGKLGEDAPLPEMIDIFCRACSVSDMVPGMRAPPSTAFLLRAAERCEKTRGGWRWLAYAWIQTDCSNDA